MRFELQPILKGELIELRPLADKDWDDLFAADYSNHERTGSGSAITTI